VVFVHALIVRQEKVIICKVKQVTGQRNNPFSQVPVCVCRFIQPETKLCQGTSDQVFYLRCVPSGAKARVDNIGLNVRAKARTLQNIDLFRVSLIFYLNLHNTSAKNA
jgi:hypothetical protein